MQDGRLRLPPLLKSLSARLLVLTIFFVMLAEVLIYAPSIARFRLVYLQERIAAAHLASLALEATPDNMVSEELAQELLSHAEAHSIVLRGPGANKLMLMPQSPPPVDVAYDLREATFMGLVMDAFRVLAQDGNRILRVMAPSPKQPGVLVETIIDEKPMRMAMYDYSNRILALSIVISLMTAALVFASLQWLMVFPMRRLTESMMAFREAPEDQSRVIVPGRRSDEIGFAERQLHDLQAALRGALRQKARLAAVGTAVTKINHDLRGILATASLVSDRLSDINDPEAKRLAPTVTEAIDKAVYLCSMTLQYAKGEVPQLNRTRFPLRVVIDEVGATLPVRRGAHGTDGVVEWENAVPEDLVAEADRDQVFRVLSNLGANAAEAGAHKVRFSAEALRNGADDRLVIEVSDDGPGLPAKARQHMFQPFAASARNGGTGLGLAIARDLARAHGGDLLLVNSDPNGTCFRLELPATKASR